ncbi:MAG TPA: hypothetical protein VF531_14275 [Bacillota bacterium]
MTELTKPRAMTRDELKALRTAGLDPACNENGVSIKVNTEMVDWILDHVYHGFNFGNVPYPECLELATKTYQLTYTLSAVEVKNS